MASLVYAVFSITNVASVHCAVRPEISPCTCEPVLANNYVELSCEKVDSFHQIVDALSNKFEPNISISLKISHSQLDDLEMLSFTDMNLNVVKLRLQWNGLRSIPELPFRGLSNVEFLSVGDNELDEIPKNVLNHLPIIKTLDLGRGRIRSVLQDDLKGIQMVKNLFLPGNNITRLDMGSFPPELVTLHLGRNQIESLNGTLRDLVKLESLFINMNSIQTLEGELPESPGLKLILAQNNSLEHLPQSMRRLHNLETLHFQNNMLRSFDGVLKNARNLNLLHAFSNQIEMLAQDEFEECEYLEELNLADNYIKSVNGSLLPLRRLRIANFSFNSIVEFSMNEIRGLKYLKQLDLSYNILEKLTGRQDNIIDQHSFLVEFILDHNHLKSLDGALMGLNRLRTLSLSHNQIERILPEDFIGLERLEILELSHNQLLTLKEMATTFLPNLKTLKVSFNNLTILDNDFHGLPVLCQANLTNNQISSISSTLVSETRCMNHNVPGKLEIYLENNPIMCDERLNELCPMMLAQEARIRGRSHCYNSELEVCGELPLIFSQNIPIIIEQLNPQYVPPNSKPVIQLIMPSPILVNGKVKKTDELRPPMMAPLGQPLIKPLLISPSTLQTAATTTTTTTNGTATKKAATAEGSETTSPSEATPATTTNNTNTTTDPIQSITPDDTLNNETEQNRTADATIMTAGYPTITTTTAAAATTTTTMTLMTTTTTTPATTTTTSTIKPILVELLTDDPPVILDIEAAELPSRSSQAIESDSVSNIVATSSSSVSNGPADYPTLEYIPKLDQFMPGSNHPVHALDEEVNNSVHEAAFSPSVVLDDLVNAQQNLQIPDEPPEHP